MTHYDRLKRKKLGDILVDEGICTEQTVITALQLQQSTGRILSQILLESRDVNEVQLAHVVVEQYQTPFVDLKSYSVHKDLVDLFPARLLHAARVVPLDRFGRQICFACQEIPSSAIVEQLREHSPAGIYLYVAMAYEIRRVLAEVAPLEEEEKLVEQAALAAAGASSKLGSLDKDTSWTKLFDSANEAVMSDLGDEDDEAGGDESG